MARKFLASLSLCFFLSIAFSVNVLALTVIDSFDSPDEGSRGLAFDGKYLWLCGSFSYDSTPIYKLNTSGNVIDSFDSPDSDPRGLAFDGTYLWLCGYNVPIHHNNPLIYKLDINGNVIDSFDSPCPNPNGLAFDGTYLWLSKFGVSDLKPTIYKLDISGNVIDSFDSPACCPFGLAFDGTYLWLSTYIFPQLDTEDTIYKLDTNGDVIKSFDSPDKWPNGLAFDGTYLWLSGGCSDKIYKLDIRTNASTSISSTTSTVASATTTTITLATPVPDTGQTKCYGKYSEITCPFSGEDFYGQDAQYIINPQSYNKLDENGDDLPDSATEWVMVRDNVTGLIWEKKTDDNKGDNIYDWESAISYCESLSLGGFTDWRLPTIKELSFIRNMDVLRPATKIDYFPNTLFGYWSSTTQAKYTGYAWRVYFDYGGYIYGSDKSSYCFVRAVRGKQTSENFIDNGDETVTDTSTGLMWQKDGSAQRNWKEALSYCENLSLAGYDDWRLPDINELQSLVDFRRYDPAIDPSFSNTDSSYYWSSTTDVDGTDSYAWVIDFSSGYTYSNSYKSSNYNVRALRGGYPISLTTTTTTESTTTTIDDGETTTTIGICPQELIYGEYSDETESLRYIRDEVLRQTPEGKEIIRLYYEWSSAIVKVMEENEEFKGVVKETMDGVLMLITEEE